MRRAGFPRKRSGERGEKRGKNIAALRVLSRKSSRLRGSVGNSPDGEVPGAARASRSFSSSLIGKTKDERKRQRDREIEKTTSPRAHGRIHGVTLSGTERPEVAKMSDARRIQFPMGRLFARQPTSPRALFRPASLARLSSTAASSARAKR